MVDYQKGCVQLNPIYDLKHRACGGFEPRLLDQQASAKPTELLELLATLVQYLSSIEIIFMLHEG